MAEDSSIEKVNPGLVAEIVSRYVAKNSIAIDQIGGLIASVHRTLSGLGPNAPAATPEAEKLTPAVSIRRSVQPDYVVCLECGFRGKILRRHLLTAHGLEPAAYRGRWKLAIDHPLTAPAYSASRSVMAKQLGLGRKPAAAEMPAAPRRPGRPRRPTTS
jgi:predicted transcriptional regulator